VYPVVKLKDIVTFMMPSVDTGRVVNIVEIYYYKEISQT